VDSRKSNNPIKKWGVFWSSIASLEW
jgi:hypothetical protein